MQTQAQMLQEKYDRYEEKIIELRSDLAEKTGEIADLENEAQTIRVELSHWLEGQAIVGKLLDQEIGD